MEYSAPTIEYTHPTGAGGYAQAYPTPVAEHSGYAPPSNVPPASPPGYQHLAPAPASAPNSIHIHNNQQSSSPMGSPASGWQQPVLSPASDATSPYPQYSPGSNDGSSYGSAPSNVESSFSSASANFQNYCNAPPTLPDNLGNNNNQQSQGTESWVKQNQEVPRTNVAKSSEVIRREKIAEYKAAKLMKKTFQTAEQYRGHGARPAVRPPPPANAVAPPGSHEPAITRPAEAYLERSEYIRREKIAEYKAAKLKKKVDAAAQELDESRPPAPYPENAEKDGALRGDTVDKGDLEKRREMVAVHKAAKLMDKNFGGGYGAACSGGSAGGERITPRPAVQDNEAAARHALVAKQKAEAEHARRLEEQRARQRVEQEKINKKYAGNEKLAQTTRKKKINPEDGQFETMHDLKCTYDREREAWAQNMALGLLDQAGGFD